MPKVKTNKGLAKRVKVTGRGKLKRHRSGGRHLMASKSGKRARRLGGTTLVTKSHVKKLKIALGR